MQSNDLLRGERNIPPQPLSTLLRYAPCGQLRWTGGAILPHYLLRGYPLGNTLTNNKNKTRTTTFFVAKGIFRHFGHRKRGTYAFALFASLNGVLHHFEKCLLTLPRGYLPWEKYNHNTKNKRHRKGTFYFLKSGNDLSSQGGNP